MITKLIHSLKQQYVMLDEIEDFLAEQHSFIEELIAQKLIDKIELTQEALIFHPTGFAHLLANKFDLAFDCIFTRTAIDQGVYQWETTVSSYNFVLRIQANEVINHAGTTVELFQ